MPIPTRVAAAIAATVVAAVAVFSITRPDTPAPSTTTAPAGADGAELLADEEIDDILAAFNLHANRFVAHDFTWSRAVRGNDRGDFVMRGTVDSAGSVTYDWEPTAPPETENRISAGEGVLIGDEGYVKYLGTPPTELAESASDTWLFYAHDPTQHIFASARLAPEHLTVPMADVNRSVTSGFFVASQGQGPTYEELYEFIVDPIERPDGVVVQVLKYVVRLNERGQVIRANMMVELVNEPDRLGAIWEDEWRITPLASPPPPVTAPEDAEQLATALAATHIRELLLDYPAAVDARAQWTPSQKYRHYVPFLSEFPWTGIATVHEIRDEDDDGFDDDGKVTLRSTTSDDAFCITIPETGMWSATVGDCGWVESQGITPERVPIEPIIPDDPVDG